jgi:hypothetical protein
MLNYTDDVQPHPSLSQGHGPERYRAEYAVNAGRTAQEEIKGQVCIDKCRADQKNFRGSPVTASLK